MQTGKAQNKQRKKNANFKRNNNTNSGNAVQIPDNVGYFDFTEPVPGPRNNQNRNRKMKPGNNRQQQGHNRGGGNKRNMNGMNGWNRNNRGGPGPMHNNGPLPPPLMMPNMNFRDRRMPGGPMLMNAPMPIMNMNMRLPPLPMPGPLNGRFQRGRMPPPPLLMPRPIPPMMRNPFQKFNNNNRPIKKNLSKVDKTKGARKNLKNNKKRNNKNNKNKNNKKNQPQNQYSLDKPWVTDEIKAEHDKKEQMLEQLKCNKNDQLFAEFKQQRDLFVLKYDEAKKAYEEKNKVS